MRRYHIVAQLARRHEVTLATIYPPRDSLYSGVEPPPQEFVHRVIRADRAVWDADQGEAGKWSSRCGVIRQRFLSSLPKAVHQCQSRATLQFFEELKNSGPYDGIWVDRAYYGEAARRVGMQRLVVDVDDLESVKLEGRMRMMSRVSLVRRVELRKLKRFERRLPERFWRTVVCKEEDRAFFRRNRENVFVVPNGVNESATADPDQVRPGEVLFVGTMSYPPNVDAAKWFAESIFPQVHSSISDAQLRIVGRDPHPVLQTLMDSQRVHVVGEVPDVEPHYATASIVIAPVRHGSGTKLKVLEALGRGKGLVATSHAVEGLSLRAGRDYLRADTSGEFAAACVELLRDPAKRLELGRSGRERVLTQFHWDVVGRKAEEAILS
jgi:glycosyltransferase involved in cell wall biosynthesis